MEKLTRTDKAREAIRRTFYDMPETELQELSVDELDRKITELRDFLKWDYPNSVHIWHLMRAGALAMAGGLLCLDAMADRARLNAFADTLEEIVEQLSKLY